MLLVGGGEFNLEETCLVVRIIKYSKVNQWTVTDEKDVRVWRWGRVWRWESKGQFSVRSYYAFLINRGISFNAKHI